MFRAVWARDLPPGHCIMLADFRRLKATDGLPWESERVVLGVKDMVGMHIYDHVNRGKGVRKDDPVRLSDARLEDITEAMTRR